MTIQVVNVFKNKNLLAEALRDQPQTVRFYDPSIFNERHFRGDDMKPGESFPVVLDHPLRTRFATIYRLKDGGFKVK